MGGTLLKTKRAIPVHRNRGKETDTKELCWEGQPLQCPHGCTTGLDGCRKFWELRERQQLPHPCVS